MYHCAKALHLNLTNTFVPFLSGRDKVTGGLRLDLLEGCCKACCASFFLFFYFIEGGILFSAPNLDDALSSSGSGNSESTFHFIRLDRI